MTPCIMVVVDVVMVKVVFVAVVEDVFGYLGPKKWLGSPTTPHKTITKHCDGLCACVYALYSAFCKEVFTCAQSTDRPGG